MNKIENMKKHFIKLAGSKQDQKIILFRADYRSIPLSYFEYSFRTRKNPVPLSLLRRQLRTAKKLNNLSNDLSKKDTFQMVKLAKDLAYGKRIDSERALNSVIADTLENEGNLKDCVFGLLNGYFHSAITGKNIRKIECLEKRVNTFRNISDILRERFNV